ncbi:MAG: hypothetical protein JWO22_4242 [Frankiales bacterium]|nr:hypothetical protein [Frankiales bacterium]
MRARDGTDGNAAFALAGFGLVADTPHGSRCLGT